MVQLYLTFSQWIFALTFKVLGLWWQVELNFKFILPGNVIHSLPVAGSINSCAVHYVSMWESNSLQTQGFLNFSSKSKTLNSQYLGPKTVMQCVQIAFVDAGIVLCYCIDQNYMLRFSPISTFFRHIITWTPWTRSCIFDKSPSYCYQLTIADSGCVCSSEEEGL